MNLWHIIFFCWIQRFLTTIQKSEQVFLGDGWNIIFRYLILSRMTNFDVDRPHLLIFPSFFFFFRSSLFLLCRCISSQHPTWNETSYSGVLPPRPPEQKQWFGPSALSRCRQVTPRHVSLLKRRTNEGKGKRKGHFSVTGDNWMQPWDFSLFPFVTLSWFTSSSNQSPVHHSLANITYSPFFFTIFRLLTASMQFM